MSGKGGHNLKLTLDIIAKKNLGVFNSGFLNNLVGGSTSFFIYFKGGYF